MSDVNISVNAEISGIMASMAKAEQAMAEIKVPALSLSGLAGEADGIRAMGEAMRDATAATTRAGAALHALEATVQGLATVARITSVAMKLLPSAFEGLPPKVEKTITGVSLAGRAMDVLRGKLGPLGAMMGYVEMRNMGLSKSYAALGTTVALAGSSVARAARGIAAAGSAAASASAGIARSTAAAASSAATSMLGPIAGAMGGVGAAVGLMGASISKAANMEGLQTAFIPLLGSADAAEARLKELSAFAAATPFELPEIAQASKVLETLTRGALSTGAGLTLVGDIASATGRPFDEVSVSVGRLYDGLQSGRPVGEAMQRLQELGVISGNTRAKIEAMNEAGQGAEAWKIAEQAMARFSGGMAMQSQTWNGLLSTFRDTISMTLAEFGKPIMDGIKPYLSDIIKFAGGIGDKAKALGSAVADSFKVISALLADGRWAVLAGESLKIAFMDAANTLWGAMNGTWAAAGAAFKGIGDVIAEAMRPLVTADFWAGMGNAFMAIALRFQAKMQDVGAYLMRLWGDLPGTDEAKANARADVMQGTADQMRAMAAGLGSDSYKVFDGIAEKVAAKLDAALGSTAGAYAAARDSSKLFDTTGSQTVFNTAYESYLADLEARRKTTAAAAASAPKPPGAEETAAPGKTKRGMEALFASSMARVGGGGGFVSAPGGDALLTETRKQTNYLATIAGAITRGGPQARNPVLALG